MSPQSNKLEATKTIPLSEDVFVPCGNNDAGETVSLTGQLNIFCTCTKTAKGVNGVCHANPQNVTGTGTVTGDKYRGGGVGQTPFRSDLDQSTQTFNFVGIAELVPAGAGGPFQLNIFQKGTITADGTLTLSVDKFTAECR